MNSGMWTWGLVDSEKCKFGYVGLRDMGLGYTGTRERWHVVTRGQKDKGARGRDKQTSPDFVLNV